MPIDIRSERLITLEEAAEMVPGRDEGKRVHPITVALWARRGKRGIRLETILAGTRTCTSVEALCRFFEAITNAPSGQEARDKASYPARSRREAKRATRAPIAELEAAGA